MRSTRDTIFLSHVLLTALLGFAGCFTDVTHTPRLDGGGAGGIGPMDVGGSGGTATVDGRGDAVLVYDSGSGGGILYDGASASGGSGGGTGNLDAVSSLGGSAGGSGGSLADGPSIQLDAALVLDVPADFPVVPPDAGADQQIGSDANGLPVGASCQAASNCANKNCVDGVCCDTTASACTGCNACSNTMTGKADGTCAPVIAGQNFHKNCTAASCSAGTFTPAATCDGLGACKTATPQNCAPFQCDTTGCLKTCTTPSDCDATTSYCDTATGKCAAKKVNGTTASLGTECNSGVVADGVCCNKACTGCYACSGAPLTAGAAGQCVFVAANQVAHSACIASGTTCGLDGKCDGAGACSYTPKVGAACDDPSNLCVTGKTCQNGTCAGGTSVTCTAPACQTGGVCSAGVCPTPSWANDGARDVRCSASAPVCVSGQCVQCFSDSDCSGNTPSCDTTTHACTCRKPSAGNLIQNPGFNTSLAGWSASFPPMQSFWTTDDSESCPGSGSVAGSVYGTDTDPAQCVSLGGTGGGAGTYFLGAKFKLPLNGNGTQCEAGFASDQFCSIFLGVNAVIGPNGANYPGTGWQNLNTSVTVPAGALSAYVYCSFDVGGGSTKIDQIYLNKTNSF
jgi:hypothetical protein